MSSTSSVHIKESVLITPSKPTPSTLVQLSDLDSQLFLRFTVESLMVYKPCPGLEKLEVIERFKVALSQALVLYYPLAGRVRSRADGLGLEVVCKAQGVLFIEAVSNHIGCEEFKRTPSKHWRKLLSFHEADVLKGAPLVVLQLTWLSDGAATLGVGINHCLSDGAGSAQFLNSVAELASGKCVFNELKPTPVWDRHLMNSTPFISSQANLLSHPEFNKVADVSGFASRYIQEKLVPTQVTFDKIMIYELKKLATSTSWLSELSCTIFEVLAAHVWRSWAQAMDFPANQVLKLLFSINIRSRIKPNLPSGYYGNAFVLGCAQTSVKDLIEKGLRYAAELIKKAKERVDNEYVRGVIELVSSARAYPDTVGVLIMTQWSMLGLERVDFGMGRPSYVGPVCCGKYCKLLSVDNQREDVMINVAIPASAVHRYLRFLRSIHTEHT